MAATKIRNTRYLAIILSASLWPSVTLGQTLQQATSASVVRPMMDHHKHLVSPVAARGSYPLPVAEIALPPHFQDLLAKRQAGWNDARQLELIYAKSAVVLNTQNEDLPSWLRGRQQVAEYIATLMGKAHRIKPVAFQVNGSRGFIAGYFHRPEMDRHFGHVLLSLVREDDGVWRIDAETPTFPGPPATTEIDAAKVVKDLDDAGVKRAVVLSVAYWFGSAFNARGGGEAEYALVRAENDWVAQQVARFPDRLVGVCSVNPLRSYALREVRRCAEQGRHKAVKLHHGNSDVDLRKAEHVKAVGDVFAAANSYKLGLVVHLWTDPGFEREGGEHAQAFLQQILPKAPDVSVQIAHMAGGGRATQPALKIFADAIAAGDPRTRKLYFDVATLVEGETPENLRVDAERIRQIGLDRILFGSEMLQTPLQGWAAFQALPLTQEEFSRIAGNVAPYAR